MAKSDEKAEFTLVNEHFEALFNEVAKQIKAFNTGFPGDHSKQEPPDPIPNSEVKLLSADGSVGSPHVRVGHRQDFIKNLRNIFGGFLFWVIHFFERWLFYGNRFGQVTWLINIGTT